MTAHNMWVEAYFARRRDDRPGMDGNDRLEIGRFCDLLDQVVDEGMDLLAYVYDVSPATDEAISEIMDPIMAVRAQLRALIR